MNRWMRMEQHDGRKPTHTPWCRRARRLTSEVAQRRDDSVLPEGETPGFTRGFLSALLDAQVGPLGTVRSVNLVLVEIQRERHASLVGRDVRDVDAFRFCAGEVHHDGELVGLLHGSRLNTHLLGLFVDVGDFYQHVLCEFGVRSRGVV